VYGHCQREGIGFLDAKGTVFQVKNSQKVQITGEAQPDLVNMVIQDVAERGRTLGLPLERRTVGV
jgi:hypothetical protein